MAGAGFCWEQPMATNADQLQWLPDGELAIERVSLDFRDTLRDMAEAAKGRP